MKTTDNAWAAQLVEDLKKPSGDHYTAEMARFHTAKTIAQDACKYLNRRATLSDSKVAAWKDEHPRSSSSADPHHFRVTLSRSDAAVIRESWKPLKRIAFDFWSSIADAEKGIKTVTPYDVLACISGDVHTPETFADFCSEFGDSEDSIKALQTFRRCSAFAKRLRAFFTEQEIEDLSEIQ